VTAPDEFQYATPQSGETKTAIAANFFGLRHSRRNTIIVIMRGWGKSIDACRVIH
jgi:hypothetical protein